MSQGDLFDLYFEYTKETESPANFHRWSLLTGIGAFLSRDLFFQLGHFTVYPNMYVKLIGAAGTRKSSAIKIQKKILSEAGYNSFSASETSKEKFIQDLASGIGTSEEDILDQNLWGDSAVNLTTSDCAIFADEWNTFMGQNNIGFLTLLTDLWDRDDKYELKLKNSKDVCVTRPTITILGGNTPTGFSQAFPPEIIGTGFLSRTLLIYGEATRPKITFPEPPCPILKNELLDFLTAIKKECYGALDITDGARLLVDKIYKKTPPIPDVRFENFHNRRLNHLLKLITITCATRLTTTITEDIVIYANTVLSHAEHFMPKALGEFGRARNSPVVHSIINILDQAAIAGKPVTMRDIWKEVHQDLESLDALINIIRSLQVSDRIQQVGDGYLPVKTAIGEVIPGVVDFSLLSHEETGMKI